ncbi:MAG: rhomboid family intramembrane serine protease [Acidobacteriota bacterium]
MDPEYGRRSHSQPEILPPGSFPEPSQAEQEPRGWYPPPQYQPPPPRPRRHWAHAPATYTLVGVNAAVYLLTLLLSGSLTGPTFEDNLSYGLLCNGYFVLNGQWWRLVTSIFVHFGWIHILANMWCLWNLGLLGEPLLGEFGIVAAYLLTGVAGNLLSVAFNQRPPGQAGGVLSAGASGAVFGLAGVLLMLLRSPLLPIPQFELKKLRRSVWYFALLNFVIDGGLWLAHTRLQVDNMAHLGGFLSGMALGVPLVPRIGAPRETFIRRRALAVGVMVFLLLLIAWGLRAFYQGATG